MHAVMSKSDITAYVNNSFIFFTWVSLSDVDLLPSLVFVGKASAVEEETT